jgi:PBP1b-binding outer membrane lipoprotein LpoB
MKCCVLKGNQRLLVASVLAAALLLQGCGVADTAATAGAAGGSTAQQVEQARQQLEQVRKELEQAQKAAAERLEAAEAAAQ